jgi:hypothetical protein
LRLAAPFGSAQGRLLRRASLAQGRLRVEVVPFPVVALAKSSEGWGRGIPCLAKDARRGAPSVVVAPANSRFLTGLSARFGMTKFCGALGTTGSYADTNLNAPWGLKPAALLVTVDAGLEGLLHPCF